MKKVSKYENKFAKLQKKAGQFNLRQQLKTVTKKEYTMEEEGAGVSKMSWVPISQYAKAVFKEVFQRSFQRSF